LDKEKIREQIKAIRREAAWVHGMTDLYGADNEKILRDAADTIEKLFSKLESTTADNHVSYGKNSKKIIDTLRMMQCKYAEIRKNDKEFEALEDAISAVERLSRSNGWISCSTENPKKEGFYVTALRDATGTIIEDIGFFALTYGWENIIPGYEVIAWNSWVEPYKEVEENE